MFRIYLLFTLILIATNAQAKSFTAADLIEPALDKDCLDYCVDGACFWLTCSITPPSCSVIVTLHISHNLPDFVVSAYNNANENPFTEVKLLDEVPTNIQDISGGSLSAHKTNNSAIKFKEVSVIGNPVAYILGRQKFFCKSNVQPYLPYYLSTLDAAMWRSGLSEMIYPASWIPGMKEVGSAFNSWGSIYPRQGFLSQPNDVKAAAVVSTRALDIVSKSGQPHIYKSNTGSFKSSGKWQMVSPEKNSCSAFGNGEPATNLANDAGQYAWTAWRRYSCCIKGPGVFIKSISSECLLSL